MDFKAFFDMPVFPKKWVHWSEGYVNLHHFYMFLHVG